MTKHPRSNFTFGFYGISLHLYKIMPRVFFPVEHFFIYMERIQIYAA